VDNKALLEEITNKALTELPKIDFTQTLTDKDAQLILGKRKREEALNEEMSLKRRKLSQQSSSVKED